MNAARSNVRMHRAQPRPLAARANPPVSRAAVEPLPVASPQDRPLAPLTDSQVDRASSPRHERDRRRLVALAENAQRPVTALESEVLDVGRARLAHTQPVQAEQHRQRSPLCMLICMQSTSVRIDVTTHEQLKRLAAELNTTVGNTCLLYTS